MRPLTLVTAARFREFFPARRARILRRLGRNGLSVVNQLANRVPQRCSLSVLFAILKNEFKSTTIPNFSDDYRKP
jgi:hypothetical protein